MKIIQLTKIERLKREDSLNFVKKLLNSDT
jgi:hypothetical protein